MQFFAQGKTKEAIKSFDIAINEDSSFVDSWIKRGFMKGMVGDFEGEMNDYNHVERYETVGESHEEGVDVIIMDPGLFS